MVGSRRTWPTNVQHAAGEIAGFDRLLRGLGGAQPVSSVQYAWRDRRWLHASTADFILAWAVNAIQVAASTAGGDMPSDGRLMEFARASIGPPPSIWLSSPTTAFADRTAGKGVRQMSGAEV